MRKVKKTWFLHNIPHQERIDYKTALEELVVIFSEYPKRIIDEKLSQGTKLGNGRGMLYQVLVITKKGGKTK